MAQPKRKFETWQVVILNVELEGAQGLRKGLEFPGNDPNLGSEWWKVRSFFLWAVRKGRLSRIFFLAISVHLLLVKFVSAEMAWTLEVGPFRTGLETVEMTGSSDTNLLTVDLPAPTDVCQTW